MTKAELIRSIQAKVTFNIPQKDVEEILSGLTSVIEDAMRVDDVVNIPGIGKFVVKDVPERRGKILLGDKAGEEYVTPAHKEPKFKMSKTFKNIFVD